jgi:hypothetical protein
MATIPLKDYAAQHNRDYTTVRNRARRGLFKTASQVNGEWAIDADEPYTDFRAGKPKTKDLTGQRFGLLVARSIDHTQQAAYWLCDCDCGKTTIVRASLLINGNTQSCSCGNGSAAHIKKTNRGKEAYRIDGTMTNQLSDKPPVNNTSGRRGVSFNRRRQKWEAYIRFSGKHYHLGHFDEFKDAVKAREDAEEKYFAPYAKK